MHSPDPKPANPALAKAAMAKAASSPPPYYLYLLSGTWWILCSILVYKHHALLLVFASFVACGVLAGGMALVTDCAVTQAPLIRSVVGLVTCAIQVGFLWHRRNHRNDTFTAVAVATGYLAFDHWYSSACLRGPWRKSILTLVEDAVTLSLALIWLVATSRRGDIERSSETTTTHRVATVWTVYKLTRQAVTVHAWVHHHCRTDGAPKSMAVPMYQRSSTNLSADTSSTASSDVGSETDSIGPVETDPPSATLQSTNETMVPASLIWTIHGVQYDLSDYVHRHPGGSEAILLGRGRDDCTALFQSYHPFTIAHAQSVLSKYRIRGAQSLPTTAISPAYTIPCRHPPTSNDATLDLTHEDEFYNILCQRVGHVLLQDTFHPVSDRTASASRTLYYVVVCALVVATGYGHATGRPGASVALAVSGWLLGALGRDAGHFAVSRRWPVVNDICVWAMSFLCNPILWQHQHTYAHHSHTNELDHDPDLYHFGTLLRVHRRFAQQSIYRYQSNPLFVFAAYTMVVFGTCFWIPWGMIQDGSLYGIVAWTDRQRPLRTAGLYLHLWIYAAFIMVLPFWVHAHWRSALVAVSSHVATSGLLFAIFSQINHLNEPSLDPDASPRRAAPFLSPAGRSLRLDESWAVQQVETSNNFCPHSTMWHFLSNGLNLQIEHHLFPGLNHCHLHRIQPTVQAVCEEYGVCYKSYDSWSELMQATLDWLDRLAVEPELKLKSL